MQNDLLACVCPDFPTKEQTNRDRRILRYKPSFLPYLIETTYAVNHRENGVFSRHGLGDTTPWTVLEPFYPYLCVTRARCVSRMTNKAP